MRNARLDVTVKAAEWLLRIEDGSLTAADRAEFLAWLKASPLNVREYLGVARTDRRLQRAFKERAKRPADAALLEQMHRAAEHLEQTAHTRSKGRQKANGKSNAG